MTPKKIDAGETKVSATNWEESGTTFVARDCSKLGETKLISMLEGMSLCFIFQQKKQPGFEFYEDFIYFLKSYKPIVDRSFLIPVEVALLETCKFLTTYLTSDQTLRLQKRITLT